MSVVRSSIRYLDGARLSRAVIAAARFVSDRAEPLNRINVFPVPDGDTGTNLAMTLSAVAQRASEGRQRHAREAALTLADEAVAGARGNSGAIFAQFLAGFSEALPDAPRLATSDFGQAVVRGAESARSAVQRPQEGTILSVLRDWARHVSERARHVRDFRELLADSLRAASDSLTETPRNLAALRKAGVVDAGAQGFVYFLEGVVRYIAGPGRNLRPEPPPAVRAAKLERAPDSILFRYCSEALLEGDGLDRDEIRRGVAALGDSIVIAGSGRHVRVHVHTNQPEELFAQLSRAGAIARTKVEDMRAQHERQFETSRAGRVAVVTDSSCDLPEEMLERLEIHVVPLRIHFGRENYLDRVTIRPEEFYGMLSRRPEAPRTSQPPPADFRETYEALAEHHEAVVSIHLSGALSGTLQAAQSAAGKSPSARVLCVDSKSASAAQGLVVRAAAEAVAAGASAEQAARIAEDAAARVRLFAVAPSVEYLVRGGRVSAGKGAVARLLRICPVLTIDREGRAVPAARAFGFRAAVRRMVELAAEAARPGPTRQIGVVHANAREAADGIAREIRRRYPESDVMILDCAPVLGAHAGPGALGIAVLAGRPPGAL